MNKQIEEMAEDIEKIEKEQGHKLLNETLSYVNKNHRYNLKEDYSLAHTKTIYELTAEELINLGYQKVDKNKQVVLSREEYDELVNLQQTHSEELTNAIQSYEEDKADLKINYDNHIKNLEKIIDRQSKDLNSQANRLIDLKAKLENSRKETAREILQRLFEEHNAFNENDVIVVWQVKEVLTEIAKQYGVEIKE